MLVIMLGVDDKHKIEEFTIKTKGIRSKRKGFDQNKYWILMLHSSLAKSENITIWTT